LNLILNDPSNSTFHHTNSNFLLSDPLIHDVGLLKRELWNHNGSVLDVVRWVLCFRELERFVADAEIVWTSYRGDVFEVQLDVHFNPELAQMASKKYAAMAKAHVEAEYEATFKSAEYYVEKSEKEN
jgi:hypothetical protein